MGETLTAGSCSMALFVIKSESQEGLEIDLELFLGKGENWEGSVDITVSKGGSIEKEESDLIL